MFEYYQGVDQNVETERERERKPKLEKGVKERKIGEANGEEQFLAAW